MLDVLIDKAEIERRKQGKIVQKPKAIGAFNRFVYWVFFRRWSKLLSTNPQIGIGIAHKLLDNNKIKRKRHGKTK